MQTKDWPLEFVESVATCVMPNHSGRIQIEIIILRILWNTVSGLLSVLAARTAVTSPQCTADSRLFIIPVVASAMPIAGFGSVLPRRVLCDKGLTKYGTGTPVVASLTRVRHAVELRTQFAEFDGLSCLGMLDTYSLGQRAFLNADHPVPQLARLVQRLVIVWNTKERRSSQTRYCAWSVTVSLVAPLSACRWRLAPL